MELVLPLSIVLTTWDWPLTSDIRKNRIKWLFASSLADRTIFWQVIDRKHTHGPSDVGIWYTYLHFNRGHSEF